MFSKNILIFAIQAFVFGLLVAFYILTINFFSKSAEQTDFYRFYKSARSFIEGKSIYTPVPFNPTAEYLNKVTEKAKATLKTLHPNLNSPFHTLSVLPFGIIPSHPAFCVWSILSLFFGLGAASLIAYSRPFHNDQTPNLLILSIILLAYYPTWVNIRTGQFGLFLLGLIVLIWLTSRKGKCQLAGIILGIAISVKIFVGLFLIFFAVQRRWKVLIWAMSTFIFCNLISLITFGLSTYKQHLELLALTPLYVNASWNASFSAFFTRIFGGAENIPLITMPMLAYGLIFSFSFLLTLGLIWVAWPRPREFSPLHRFDMGFSLTIVAMLLISPLGWMYYFPTLIISLLVAWHASSALNYSKLFKSLLVVTWILSSIPTTLINSEEIAMNQPMIWFTSAGYYFYALIAFCGLLFVIFHRLHAHEKPSRQWA